MPGDESNSLATMILCIDAGNSMVKWGIAENDNWLAQGKVAHADIPRLAERWQPYGVPQRIVIANVAGEKVRSALNVLFMRWRIAPTWIAAEAAQCGVRNGYAQPAQLGSDRWAALIAARGRTDHACVVVGVGTATTIDALSADGEFIGGAIAPGVQLMQEALLRKIPQLNSSNGRFEIFAKNTPNAVVTGTTLALAGAVDLMRAALRQISQSPVACLASGGGADALHDVLPADTQFVDNLVLEGLLRIARA